MSALLNGLSRELRRLWQTDRPLTALGVSMLILLVFNLAALFLDPRVITGAPAWLKPTKFAVSIAILSFSLAWLFRYLPQWPRLRRWSGGLIVIALVVEEVIINGQAWRGTTSHFNAGTPLDQALFSIMGISILVLWFATIAITVALFRQRFVDSGWGWALRMGMVLLVFGSGMGGLMTKPTSAQLAAARRGEGMPLVGAHTVGAPDGSPGVPGTGWSRQHGDLRVPHFFGMHGLQIVPLLAYWLGRRRSSAKVMVAAFSYAGVFGLLLWQALRGQSLLQPDGLTLAAWAAWAVLSIAAATWAAPRHAVLQGVSA